MTSPSLTQPGPAKLKARTDFSVTLEVPPSTINSSWYRYEYKEAGSTWEKNAQHVDAMKGASEVILDDLNPTSTYQVRVYEVVMDSNGTTEHLSKPSQIAAVDTDVPGCGPDSNVNCTCTIQ
ncbi:unnamed protein product [Peronospora belbahrii]|uniref:Fibronectin type-III domain-containing protein n=1 Tax=Peronospora belbahrii TaxID=622444 RepID=A0AAU9L4J9_9STRA|nr:unnamed protein product [Peronospora belbahrii]CAH0518891.1 unnamed protein product [Peronospora belbahrii]